MTPLGHKLFFALWPDEAARLRLAAAVDGLARESRLPPGRRVKPQRLHMTLPFLGDHAELPDELVAAACAAAQRVQAQAFDLVFDHLGSFVGARVGWLGCREPPSALRALHDDLVEALHEQRCRVERAQHFVPHVTVLREVQRVIDITLDVAVPWRVDAFVLIASRPSGDYDLLGRWVLR